jgi:hypothetical protein
VSPVAPTGASNTATVETEQEATAEPGAVTKPNGVAAPTPEPEASTMTDNSDPVPCSTWDACIPHDGQRVAIIGVYTLHRPLAGMKGGGDIVRVRIVPEGGRRGPYLEPYWHTGSRRDATELAALDGKRVRVVGTLYLTPPTNPKDPPGASTMGGAVIHPVEGISEVE